MNLHAAAQMKPLEGAEAGGALGFFKGVGKGLVGCVSNSAQSKNCPEVNPS